MEQRFPDNAWPAEPQCPVCSRRERTSVCGRRRARRRTNLVSDSPRLFLKCADRKCFRLLAIRKVTFNKFLQVTGPLALRNMDELVNHQFTIAPGISPDNDAISDCRPPARIGNDLSLPGCLSQFLVLRQW